MSLQPIAADKFCWVVAAFFAIDAFIVIAWVLLDPLRREEQQFHLVVSAFFALLGPGTSS